jgi:hypothetical protein
MDVRQILTTINGDLASAPAARVIYVEGDTDPPMFFGLLGITPAVTGSFVHQSTLVRGLGGKGKVAQYVQVALANGLAGRVFGVADGDGEELVGLVPRFDHPYSGPLFTWKAYSIESFFPQCPWEAAWGPAPNWQVELAAYAPYVALGRVHVRLESIQGQLRLARRTSPETGQPLLTVQAEKARLAADKHPLTGFDPESIFDEEVQRFQTALGTSIPAAMALMDGKWVLGHFMAVRCGGGSLQQWRARWIASITASGGLAEVRDLWRRITGSPP